MSLALKETCKKKWNSEFKKALDCDTWGQSLEAVDSYQELRRSLQNQMPDLSLSTDERSVLMKIRHALNLRIEGLEDLAEPKISLDDMKKISTVVETLFERSITNFPVILYKYSVAEVERKEETPLVFEEKDEDAAAQQELQANIDGGDLLSAPAEVASGKSILSIEVEKIGLKDAGVYIEPRIAVHVVDQQGNPVDPVQTTRFSTNKQGRYVVFGDTVHIQTPYEDLVENKYNIFFEFKHYKPEKKKVSTRCFAFMEYDELRVGNGNMVLELYRKPTDFKRKRIKLFTEKPLYFHIRCTYNKH